jgi:hypothetical protein
MDYKANIVISSEGSAITVYAEGQQELIANEGHPKFAEIQAAVMASEDYDTLVDLFSPARAVTNRFERLTDRIAVRGGTIYFDGDPLHNAITDHIVRALDADSDFTPLLRFVEKVMCNMEKHSRDQLYGWLDAKNFTITDDGDIVGYKKCKIEDGIPMSITSGHAIADGVEYNGYIPNVIGTVVEMPRSEVVHDPSEACSVGLHVGTPDFAKAWGGSSFTHGRILLELQVNPRDVVSVPSENAEKFRCCRYTVVGEVDGEAISEPVIETEQPPAWTPPVEDFVEHADESETPEPVNVKHPSRTAFTVMQQRAKRRKRNFVAYATKMGPWTLMGDDGSKRTHWSV